MSDAEVPVEKDPNAPWSPEEIEGTKPSLAEIEAMRSQIDVIQEVIDWFDEQIAGYLNPNVISGVTPKSSPEEVKEAVLFAQKMSTGYSKKRDEFFKRFAQYLEKSEETPAEE